MSENKNDGFNKFYDYFNLVTSGGANILHNAYDAISSSASKVYAEIIDGPYGFSVLNAGVNSFRWSVDGVASIPSKVDSIAQTMTSSIMGRVSERPGCSEEGIQKRNELLQSITTSSSSIKQELSDTAAGLDCINLNVQTMEGAIASQKCQIWRNGNLVANKMVGVFDGIQEAYKKENAICASKQIVQNPLLPEALKKNIEVTEAEREYHLQQLDLNKRLQSNFYCSSVGDHQEQKVIASCAGLGGQLAMDCYGNRTDVASILGRYKSLSIPVAAQDRESTFYKCADLFASAERHSARVDECNRAISYNDKMVNSHSSYAGDSRATYLYSAFLGVQWFVIGSVLFVLLGKAAVSSMRFADRILRSVDAVGRRFLGDGVMDFFAGFLYSCNEMLSVCSRVAVRFYQWDFWASLRERRLLNEINSSRASADDSDSLFGLGTVRTRSNSRSKNQNSDSSSDVSFFGVMACAAAIMFAFYSIGLWLGYLWNRFVVGESAIELGGRSDKERHQEDVCQNVEDEVSPGYASQDEELGDDSDMLQGHAHMQHSELAYNGSKGLHAVNDEDEGFGDDDHLYYSTTNKPTARTAVGGEQVNFRVNNAYHSDDKMYDSYHTTRTTEPYYADEGYGDDRDLRRPFFGHVENGNEGVAECYSSEEDHYYHSEDETAHLSDAHVVSAMSDRGDDRGRFVRF